MADHPAPVSPYETDPTGIPPTDRYADLPLYGRYRPSATDFVPDAAHVNSTSPAALAYWEAVLAQCTPAIFVYNNELEPDGRDVFALGSVIVKSGHLHATPMRDFAANDANEVAAVALAREPLAKLGVRVPKIYFAGKIQGRDVLVQQRLPSVGLNIAAQYLDSATMHALKTQARTILRALHALQPAPAAPRGYLVPVADPVACGRIRQAEADILFAPGAEADADRGLMHNDFSESNTIVDDGRIVGLVDWEMAGFFDWETARQVHLRIRGVQRENYAQLEGKKEYEDLLNKMFFWNDLYDSA